MLGNVVVYREVNGKVVMSNRPKKPGKPASEDQQAVRDRFLEATQYARAAQADPALKADYEAVMGNKYLSVYAAATADYLKLPRILSVDTSLYTGTADDAIGIRAFKDLDGLSVHVTIRGNDGSVLEAGEAVQQPGRVAWTYKATVANATMAGTTITVRITDRPGNVVTQEYVL